MAKPQSIKTQPWTSFEKQPYSILHDDYPHEKPLVEKITQKTSKSTITYKSTYETKENQLKQTSDLKFWFTPKEGKTIYTRLKENYIKLHYDNGITEPIAGHKYNFYGSFQSNKNFKGGIAKIGACYISETVLCNNRIRLDSFDSKFKQSQFSYYHKSQYIKNNWKFGLYGAFNFTKRLLLNNAVLIGYKKGQAQYFLRADNSKWRSQPFDYKNHTDYFQNLTFDYVRNINPTFKLGLEIDLLSRNERVNQLTAAFEKSFPEEKATVKGRISSAMNVALNVKRDMGSYGSYLVGLEVCDLGKTNIIKYGAQIDLNL